MESTPESSTAGCLVHQDGQVQGPFTLRFLAAMALGGVFKPTALVEQPGNGTRMPLDQACAEFLQPLPEIPLVEEPYNAFQEWVRDRRKLLITIGAIIGGLIMITVWSSHNNRPISSPALPPSQPTNDYPYSYSSPSAQWAASSVPLPPPPLPPPSSYGTPGFGAPSATSPSSPPTTSTSLAPPSHTPPPPPPPPAASQVYKDSNGHTYSVSNEDYLRLAGRQAALDLSRKEINTSQAQYDVLEAEVDRERASLDRSSQFAVDQFNDKINRLNAMSDALQRLVDSFNLSVNNFNAELERVGRRIN